MTTTCHSLLANRRAAGDFAITCGVLPLDTISMSQVMSLSSFLIVEQNYNRGNEVKNLASWKEVDISSAVSATITIPVWSQGNSWTIPGDLIKNSENRKSTVKHSYRLHKNQIKDVVCILSHK